MQKNLGYLEIVSDSPGPLMLLLGFAQTGDSLLRPELEVGELGPRVGGQGLPEVSHLPPSRHVQLPSASRCRLYVASQLLSDRILVTIVVQHSPDLAHRPSLTCHFNIIPLH